MMKFKSKKSKGSKESKGSHRTSKAADEHLDEEIEVWANDSFSSGASSVTAPPSQTASFYKRIQNDHFDFSSSDDSESLQEGQTNRSSDDDNLSWADNRSRDSNSHYGGGDSQGAVQKPSKKGKKKGFRKGRRKLFGGAIQEDHDGENEDAPKQSTGRRGRRLSLFGNSGHSTQASDDPDVNRSTDGEFSVNHSSDDGCRFSQDGSQDGLGTVEAAPAAITRGKAKRRGSLGGYFSKKENQGHHSDDAGHLSQDGASRDGLGYEDAAPSISREKPKRRGSLGGLFTKKEHTGHHSSDEGGQLSNDEGLGYGYEEAAPSVRRENGQRRGSLGGHFAKKENQGHQSDDGGPRSLDGSIDTGLEFCDEDAAPVITREKTKRRGSLGGLFKKESRHSPPPPDVEARHEKPHRVRRNSMFGGTTENASQVPKHDQPSVNEQSTTAASAISTSKGRPGNRRRHSLTGGSSSKGGSSNKSAAAPPKDPHWIINQERKARGMYLYERSLLLDTLARSLSNELANGLPPTPTEFYGNVGRGKSLQMIHDTIMDDRGGASRKNILSEKFTEFGVSLTQGLDGQFYMVALFKE